ncbi:MAG TPA: pitrilysin family protein [Candidatus Polarisedimenticolaceae bacterium]
MGFPAGCLLAAALVQARLENGLEVSILRDPEAPVVATQVWIHAGAADEREGERGLAHLFEHLMFGGTAAHPREDYAALHHRHGGYQNAMTTPDETVYVSTIAPGAFDAVLEMEADRFRSLDVTPANLENEKRIVLEELRMRTENDPLARAFVAAQRQLLGGHPYAYDASGNKDEVAAATVERAREFRDRHYRADRAHLVIVGPVDPEATLAEVKARFGTIPAGAVPVPEVPALDGWTFPAKVAVKEDIPPVEVAIAGFVLPPAGSPDGPAIDVMLQLLDGGAVDRFRETLVVDGKRALEGGTESLRLRRGGAVVFYGANLPYRREKTAFRDLDRARATLASLDWLTDASVDAAKRSLRRDRLRRSYFVDERADAIGRARWWLGDAALALDEDARLAAVTREDVAAAFRRYVGGKEPIRLYARPERVPLWVRLFGWLYPVVR